MKAQKIFGVIFVVSVLAVIVSTVALTTTNKEIVEINSDVKGVHTTEYTMDLIRGPVDGQTDTPIQGVSDKGPVDGQTDTPIQGVNP